MNIHHIYKAKRKYLFVIMLWFFILVVSKFGIEVESVFARSAYQTDDDAQCTAIDVVILLDQSLSMSSVNDPNNGRFQAAKSIVEYLGNQSVWLCSDKNIEHRIAVVGFGDQSDLDESGEGNGNPYQEDVETYLEPMVIPPINDFNDWKNDRVGIKIDIDSGKGKNLRATDHLSALLAAADILQEWRNDPLSDEDRRQAVILVTDGEPCLFNRACTVDNYYYDILPDMDEIELLTDPQGDTFAWRGSGNDESTYLSVIVLSQRSGAYTDAFLDKWRDIAQNHGGDLHLANPENTDISPLIADAMTPIVGSSTTEVLCDEEIWIEPYVDNLVILYAFALTDDPNEDMQVVINVESGESHFAIQDGNSSSSMMKVADFIKDGQNAVYIFEPPVPGSYKVQVPGFDNCVDKLEVRIDRGEISAEVDTPASNVVFPAVTEPPYYNLQAAEKFRVKFLENNGDPLHEFDGYPLTVGAVVTSEDGSHTQELLLQRTNDGVYESNDVIRTPVSGSYDWEVVATVPNPRAGSNNIPLSEQGDITIFTDEGSFTASPVVPFGFKLIQPVNGDEFALNTVLEDMQIAQKIPVEVMLLDKDGQSLSARDVFESDTDFDLLFEATLHSNGASNLETISLTVKPGTNNQIFEGAFTNDDNGYILPAGEYLIEVDAIWTQDDYPVLDYMPANVQDSVTIKQYEVRPLSAVIHPPEDGLTLHETYPLDTVFGKLKPFEFSIDIVDAISGEVRVLDSVLISKDSIHLVTVIAPSGNSVPITLTVKQDEYHEQLIGIAGVTLDEDGDYVIKVNLEDIALQEGFAWSTPEKTVDFSREDTMMTKPFIWQIIAAMIALVIFLVVGFIVYKMTGGPSGTLVVVGKDSYGNEREEWSKKLSYIPRRNRVKGAFLKDAGVAVIYVTRAKSFDQEVKYAVEISAVNEDGIPVFEGILDNDDPQMFVDEGDILYRRS